MPESSRFRTHLASQRVHWLQSLLKSARQHFDPNFQLTRDKFNYKKFLFVRCEILGVFAKTLTTAPIYSRHNSEKFARHVQTPLS